MTAGSRTPGRPRRYAPAFRRSARLTVASCAAFYSARHAFGDPVMATYAIFGVIALGVLSQVPGPPRRKARTLVAALPAGAVLVAVGTVLAGDLWAAAAGMFAVGFLVTFSGLGGPRFLGVAAGLHLFYMLACFPPYEPDTLDSRLLGLTYGVVLLAAAELFLWPDPPPIPYDHRLAKAAAAVSRYATAVAATLAGDPPTTRDKPEAAEGPAEGPAEGAERPAEGSKAPAESSKGPAEGSKGLAGSSKGPTMEPAGEPGPLTALEAEAHRATEAIRPSRLPATERPTSPGARDRALTQAGAATRFLREQLHRLSVLAAQDPAQREAVPRLLHELARTARSAADVLSDPTAPPPPLDALTKAIRAFKNQRLTPAAPHRDRDHPAPQKPPPPAQPDALPGRDGGGSGAESPRSSDRRGGQLPWRGPTTSNGPRAAGSPEPGPSGSGALGGESESPPGRDGGGSGAGSPGGSSGRPGEQPPPRGSAVSNVPQVAAPPGDARLRRGAVALQAAEGALILAIAVRVAVGADVPPDRTPAAERPGPFWYAYERAPMLWWRRFRGSLTPRSVAFQNAVRVALALAVARLLAGALDVGHGFWVLLATLSLMRTSAADTRTTLRPAFLGTLSGAVATGLLLVGVGERPLFYEIALPVTMLAAFTVGPVLGLAWMQGGFTVVVAMIFTQLAPATWTLAETRVVDIMTGGAVGAVIGLLAWPRGGAGELRRDAAAFLSDAAAAMRETVAVVTGADRPKGAAPRARRMMFLADTAYAQYQSERPAPGMREVDWQGTLLAAHRMVWGGYGLLLAVPPGALAPWPGAAGELQVAADRLAEAYGELSVRLRTGAGPTVPRPEPPHTPTGSVSTGVSTDQGRLFAMDVDVWLTSLGADLARVQSPPAS
ncbi:FUSC family protein [Streptomyces pathocidini]|uniref:FUSC family protein n=1 Tax=Streptomyces pathocidini TaxID=1650571 RepID=UPI0033F3AB91